MQALIRLIVSTTLIFAGHTWADSLLLKNGDRLTGKVILIDAGKLLLKTTYAGTISIDTRKIASIETTKQLHIKEQRFSEPVNARLQPAEQGKAIISHSHDHSVAIADIYQALPVTESKLTQDLLWTGSMHLSADFKRKESSSDSYDIDAKTKLRHGHWRHNAELEYDYETKDDSKKTDQLMASYALDRFFSERWFWQGKYKFNHDQLEDLTKQHTYGTGPGFQFWDNELGSLSLAGLINHSIFQYKDGHKERFNSSTLSWDYQRFFLTRTLEFFNKGELAVPFTNEVDYVLDAETGLRYKLNSWASLSLKAEWEKIRSKYGDVNNRRYLMGVGVTW
ncbi:MAG: DUF481 domain-containing protein [Thiopseudomonas sp.]|nr:DUF481 domain-containing protein [Thiopseudomonas sp.]